MYEVNELIQKISNVDKYLEFKNSQIVDLLNIIKVRVSYYKEEYLLDNDKKFDKNLLDFKYDKDFAVSFSDMLENMYRPIMSRDEYETYLKSKTEVKVGISKSATIEMRLDLFIQRIDNAIEFLNKHQEEEKQLYLRLFEIRHVFGMKRVIDYIDDKNNPMISFFRNDNKDEIYCLRTFFSELFLDDSSFKKVSLKDNKFVKMFRDYDSFKMVTHTNRYTAFKSNNSSGIFVINEKKDERLNLVNFNVDNREISSGAAAQKGVFNLLNKILEAGDQELVISQCEECISFIELFFEPEALDEIHSIFKHYIDYIYGKDLQESISYNSNVNFKEIRLPFNNTYKRIKILSKSNIENNISRHISAIKNANFELLTAEKEKDKSKKKDESESEEKTENNVENNVYKEIICKDLTDEEIKDKKFGLFLGEKRIGTMFYKDENASLNFGMSRKYFNLIKNREIVFKNKDLKLDFTIENNLLKLSEAQLNKLNYILKDKKQEMKMNSTNDISNIIENLNISEDFYDQKINRTIATGYLSRIIEDVFYEIDFKNITLDNSVIDYKKDVLSVQLLFLFFKELFLKGFNVNKNLSNSLEEFIYNYIRNKGDNNEK